MKNTQDRIDRIAEELRDIYKNTNEGPRLIAELVAELPNPRRIRNTIYRKNPDMLETVATACIPSIVHA
jgi:hypothetical protein